MTTSHLDTAKEELAELAEERQNKPSWQEAAWRKEMRAKYKRARTWELAQRVEYLDNALPKKVYVSFYHCGVCDRMHKSEQEADACIQKHRDLMLEIYQEQAENLLTKRQGLSRSIAIVEGHLRGVPAEKIAKEVGMTPSQVRGRITVFRKAIDDLYKFGTLAPPDEFVRSEDMRDNPRYYREGLAYIAHKNGLEVSHD